MLSYPPALKQKLNIKSFTFHGLDRCNFIRIVKCHYQLTDSPLLNRDTVNPAGFNNVTSTYCQNASPSALYRCCNNFRMPCLCRQPTTFQYNVTVSLIRIADKTPCSTCTKTAVPPVFSMATSHGLLQLPPTLGHHADQSKMAHVLCFR